MKLNYRLVAAAAIAGCLSVSLVGCGNNGGTPQAEARGSNTAAPKPEESKETQCQKIIALHNTAQGELKEAAKTLDLDKAPIPEKVATFKTISDTSAKYSTQFQALNLKDAKLQSLQKSLGEHYQAASKITAEIHDGFEKKDEAAMKTGLAGLDELGNEENTLMAELNQYCGAK
jgi:hypothetical protein